MKDREAYVLHRMGVCRHYDGLARIRDRKTECEAGVKYPDAPLPCITLMRPDPPTIEERRAQCPSLACYSREEAEAAHDEMEAYMAKTSRVLAAVARWRTWTEDNRVGKAEVIECPECKGRLRAGCTSPRPPTTATFTGNARRPIASLGWSEHGRLLNGAQRHHPHGCETSGRNRSP